MIFQARSGATRGSQICGRVSEGPDSATPRLLVATDKLLVLGPVLPDIIIFWLQKKQPKTIHLRAPFLSGTQATTLVCPCLCPALGPY